MSKCIGCGVELQTTNPNEIGYHSQAKTRFCERCFKLTNYGKYQPVSLSNKDYQKIIEGIKDTSLVVYVADILSLNLSNIPKFSKMLLVLTKRDILPKSVKEEKIIQNIKQEYPLFLDIICVSSLKNYQLDTLYNALKKHSNGQAIYLIGATNSGKSTLINKLISNYDEEKKESSITVSMYPATTLDKVEIKLGNLKIIDTPGLIEEGNLVNILSKEDLKKVTPKKEIKPKSCQIKGKGSIIVDKFVRIDYETTNSNSLVIYTSNLLDIRFASLKSDILKEKTVTNFTLPKKKDIVIPGLGFIKFVGPIQVAIYTLDNVIPYERDNLI